MNGLNCLFILLCSSLHSRWSYDKTYMVCYLGDGEICTSCSQNVKTRSCLVSLNFVMHISGHHTLEQTTKETLYTYYGSIIQTRQKLSPLYDSWSTTTTPLASLTRTRPLEYLVSCRPSVNTVFVVPSGYSRFLNNAV